MKNKIFIFSIILILAIGFASVSTFLLLNGTINVGFNTDDFDVYFSNANVNGVNKKNVIKEDRKIEFSADMSLIGEKYELEYFITNGSRNYDAELTINCTESNEYLNITNDFVNGTVLAATETTGGNKLVITVAKAYAGTEEEPTKDFDVSCEIIATPKSRKSQATGTPANKVEHGWELTNDNDLDGTVSKGDLITLDTESFYVLDVSNEKIIAIAQYNLYEGTVTLDISSEELIDEPTGMQDSRARGAIYDPDTFLSIYPWVGNVHFTTDEVYNEVTLGTKRKNNYSISLIKTQVDAYGLKLNEMGGHIDEIRLITKDELVEYGCNEGKNTCRGGYAWGYNGWVVDSSVSDVPSYLRNTSYYTSSPYSTTSTYVWFVLSDGVFGYGDVTSSKGLGIRPVIEISTSLF